VRELVIALSQVGLILNANKTVVFTTEALPPQHLQLPSGERIAILEHILTAQSSKLHHGDVSPGVQGIFRKPLLDLGRPSSIDCDKAEILTQGGDYRGMICCCPQTGSPLACRLDFFLNMDVS